MNRDIVIVCSLPFLDPVRVKIDEELTCIYKVVFTQSIHNIK